MARAAILQNADHGAGSVGNGRSGLTKPLRAVLVVLVWFLFGVGCAVLVISLSWWVVLGGACLYAGYLLEWIVRSDSGATR